MMFKQINKVYVSFMDYLGCLNKARYLSDTNQSDKHLTHIKKVVFW